jgi:DNA polymerase III delta subunit
MAQDQKSKLGLEEMCAAIEKGRIDPVYFLNGAEEYLKIEVLALLRRQLFGDAKASTNVERITATSGSAQTIADLVSDYSLFSGGRLVIVYDIQKLSPKGQEALIPSLSSIPQGNHLVIFGPPSFDRRRKLFKYLAQNTTWATLLPLSEKSAPYWIKRRFKKNGIEISQPAVEKLLGFVGHSYGLLATQIDKLAIAFSGKEKIEVADIESHTAAAAEYDVFHLLAAVGQNDRPGSLEALNRLLERSDGVGSVLFWLAETNFQYYYVASNRKKMTQSEMSAHLHISSYRLQRLLDESSGHPVSYYEESIRSIIEAEISIRFDQIPSRIILESLIISLTARNGGNKQAGRL